MLTRTQKKQQDVVLAQWLYDHGIPSMDEFLENYYLIRISDPTILDDLYNRLDMSVGLLRHRGGISEQV